jgi:hypothetical protein
MFSAASKLAYLIGWMAIANAEHARPLPRHQLPFSWPPKLATLPWPRTLRAWPTKPSITEALAAGFVEWSSFLAFKLALPARNAMA